MAGTIAGSLIFDTKTDTTGFERGTDEIDKKAEKMEESFNQLGKAVIAAFSVNAIKGMGLALIEASAELQALDAQFDQIFKGAENQKAIQEINKQSEELGIHADRLKKSFSSFGAQLKGAGLVAQKALEGTSKATRLAADAAAFYDVSLETASASLASFLKGNFEAGDAIGVFTNATQMSVQANDVYGKSWDKLTEAEKQWLLLDKVSDVYKLNGAVGQATREQDNWANAVENLKATWTRFKDSIGPDLLNSVTSILQGLTAALQGLIEMMQKNPETTKAFMDTLTTFLGALATYLIVKNVSGLIIGLSTALTAFDLALASPATKVALVAGAIFLLTQMFMKLSDAMSDMDTLSQVIFVLEALTTAALAAALAVGIFETASTMGAAAISIGVGIAAMIATMKMAESNAKSMKSSGGGSIPRLATGAVIPPNSEFLAILGDQKSGRNLEAPEGLIRQIMREELSGRGGAGNGTATVILQVDGREYARAMAPYSAGETQRLGVRLSDR